MTETRFVLSLPCSDPSSATGTLDLTLPRNWDGVHMVLALHGSGRGIADYHTVPFYSRQIEIALCHGYGFAVLENGSDTYGTDIGYARVVSAAEALLYHWIREDAPKKLTPWATSAVGIGMYRYAAEHSANVRALIGTFAMLNLTEGFRRLASCRKAWGAEDMSAEDFRQLVMGKNPADMMDKLCGIPIYLAHGNRDTAVSIDPNARRLAKESDAVLYEIPDGIQGIEDMRYYQRTLFSYNTLTKERNILFIEKKYTIFVAYTLKHCCCTSFFRCEAVCIDSNTLPPYLTPRWRVTMTPALPFRNTV